MHSAWLCMILEIFGFAPLLCDEVSVSASGVYLQRVVSSCCLPSNSAEHGHREEVPNLQLTWHGGQTVRWHYTSLLKVLFLIPAAASVQRSCFLLEFPFRPPVRSIPAEGLLHYWSLWFIFGRSTSAMSGPKHHLRVHRIYDFLLLIFQIINMYLVYIELSVSQVYVSYASTVYMLFKLKLKVKTNKPN